MGLITATFFECGVRYERTTEEGTTKKVVDAFANTTLDYEIATLDETKYFDVFLHDTNHSAEKTD